MDTKNQENRRQLHTGPVDATGADSDLDANMEETSSNEHESGQRSIEAIEASLYEADEDETTFDEIIE